MNSLSESNNLFGQTAVESLDLSVTFKATLMTHPTLKNRLLHLFKGTKIIKKIDALNKINIKIKYGQVVGIIGSNGSGKTTLMRSIGGIVLPTSGEVSTYGKVETLLALGVGFNKELTGRQNVILGGLASGLSKAEILRKMDEIIEFSELSEFIDLPMRTYSSGMGSRLAFALALSVEPDILIIDEALSTGDAKFKEKSLNKVKSMRNENRALILVSHALATIEDVCNEVIWLEKGKILASGDPKEVVAKYKEYLKVGKSSVILEDI